MAEMRKSMMGGQGAPTTLPERLAREDKLVTAHLAALKKTEEAVARLYGVLTDDQKKVADTIVVGPMGMPILSVLHFNSPSAQRRKRSGTTP